MNDTQYSLLDEPIIQAHVGGQERWLTLPQVLATLSTQDIDAFDALQVHQQQPWFCFLVQLAAMAMHQHGQSVPPSDEAVWRGWLLSMTEGKAEPWSLCVSDPTVAAFMQPPITKALFEKAKTVATCPDELDMLITTKNHDVKKQRIVKPMPQHWLYALLTVQTMDGYGGAKIYNIVRMNGGSSSRPMVGRCWDDGWGERFRRDLKVLLGRREQIIAAGMYRPTGGESLLWLRPWTGLEKAKNKEQYTLPQCDPYFIEICRIMRLRWVSGRLEAVRLASVTPRIHVEKKAFKGVTHDPWSPVVLKESKNLTLAEGGFSYDLTRQIILGDGMSTPLAMEIHDSGERNAEHKVVLTCLARGNSKTAGFHQRRVSIPGKVSRRAGNPSEKQRIAAVANQRAQDAGKARSKILYPALKRLTDKAIEPWTKAFDAEVDDRFFEALWEALEQGRDAAALQWQDRLVTLAFEQLRLAQQEIPLPVARRWKCISASESMFWGCVHKTFPELRGYRSNLQEADHG